MEDNRHERYDAEMESGARRFLRRLGAVRWAFPIVLLLVGLLVPPLRVPVGWPETGTLWALLFGSFIAMVFWLIAEIYTTTSRLTSSTHLQWDDFISMMVFAGITYWAGRLGSNLEWFIMIPWIGAFIDSALSGVFGINNATQKTFGDPRIR